MKSKLIYLAGPISQPNPMHNLHEAVQVASHLIAAGYTPYLPQLSVMHDAIRPETYEDWMAYDFRVIANCGLLVRIPGPSEGADREIKEAQRLGVPVYIVPHGGCKTADRIISHCETMERESGR